MISNKKHIIVAIDGFSSCGKSTIAKQLAKYAGYTYVDTGAMYRAVALYKLQLENKYGKEIDIVQHLPEIHIMFTQTPNGQHIVLNGQDVENEIRTLEVGNMASIVSPIPEVRSFLVAMQQEMGHAKGIVMDGRDIGTIVFPEAELKLFMTASPEVRAKRRFDELKAKGGEPVFEEVLKDVNERDYRDTHRAISPLRPADDAIIIDNSDLTKEEQMNRIYTLFDNAIES